MDLTVLDGVGEEKAQRLKEHDYNQLEDIAYASLLYFDQIDGVSRDLVVQAQEILQENPYIGYRLDTATLDPDLVGRYWCAECSKSFAGNQALFALNHHDCNPNEPDWVLQK